MAALAIAASAVFMTAGCSDFLEVTNPGAVEEPSLNDAAYLQLLHDGTIGEFQPAYAWTALFSGMFTDELRVHHSYFENLEIDARDVNDNNGTYALSVFNGLHRARFMADSSVSRYKVLLGDSVQNDVRYATILTYAGYSWSFIGEQLCESRINAQGAPLSSQELLGGALDRFDEAIAAFDVARAAAANIANATVRTRVIATADSLQNVARVGAARAALNMNSLPAAIAYAQAVTPAYVDDTDQGFRYNLMYRQGASTGESRRFGSPYWEFVSAGGSWVSLTGTGFENLNDPRVPHDPAGTISVAGGGDFIVPNAPRSFNTYTGTVEGARFVGSAGANGTISTIRIASAMEARYIIAEAEGNTPGNVDFVNAQRAIGGQTPLVTPTEAEYDAALREQRAREFFVDGHRMGDLRRYEAFGGTDLWATGPMYGGTNTFGSQKCWPTPLSEQF